MKYEYRVLYKPPLNEIIDDDPDTWRKTFYIDKYQYPDELSRQVYITELKNLYNMKDEYVQIEKLELDNKYAKQRRENSLVYNEALIDLLKYYNTKEDFKCLELGCNAGYNLKAVSQIFPKAVCQGIDIDKKVIDWAKEEYPNIDFRCCDILDIEYPYDTYDFIFLPDILEHLTNPDLLIENLYHTLKDDGYIIACVPNSIMHYAILYHLIVMGNFDYTSTGLLDNDHKHLFTLRSFEKLFLNNDFNILEIKTIQDKEEYNQEEIDFINKLVELSNNNIEEIEFKTFEYFIIAQKKKEIDKI